MKQVRGKKHSTWTLMEQTFFSAANISARSCVKADNCEDVGANHGHLGPNGVIWLRG